MAGPSIASHGPFFQRLGRGIRDVNCAYVVLTSGECPNLKTFLKTLIKKVTSRVEDDDEDDLGRPAASSKHGPKFKNGIDRIALLALLLLYKIAKLSTLDYSSM